MSIQKFLVCTALLSLSAPTFAIDLGSATIAAGGNPTSISTKNLNYNFKYDITCHIMNKASDSVVKVGIRGNYNYEALSYNDQHTGFPLQALAKRGDNILKLSGLETGGDTTLNFFNSSDSQDLTVTCSAQYSIDE